MDVSLLSQLTIHSLLTNNGVIGHNHLSIIFSKPFDHVDLRYRWRAQEDLGDDVEKSSQGVDSWLEA